MNALVWRLHEQSKSKKPSKKLSITKGRSMCPNCKHELAAKDLIPVISWLSLFGKCRYCKKQISWQYPVVEILTATLFIISYCYWSMSLQGSILHILMYLVFLSGLVIGMALSVYDFKWMFLPDRLVRILAVQGLLFASLNLLDTTEKYQFLLQLVLSIGVSGGLFYVLFQLSKGKWIGGGDVKLGLVLGLFLLKPVNGLIMLFVSSVLGCLYAIILMITGKYKQGAHIPFGPFLLLASYVVIVYSDTLLQWLKNYIYL
ncbi:prepilin peptidase [Candidatus Saccharibacteria bacterium]|nr:prepilin peptidase [Candidatus Saccharibacteria bacterium]